MGMGAARGGARGWVPGERWRRVLFLALASVSFLVSLILLFLSAPRLRLPGPTPSSSSAATAARRGPDAPPCLAYLLTGARGDGRRLLRLLLAVYHPRNRYVLHLSADAPDAERRSLAAGVAAAAPAVGAFGNVAVVGTPTAGTPVGSSGLAGTLRAAAVLLRLHPDWDWFLTLSAADYPLVTQDDLIHVLSSVPRDLNFIDHTSDIGPKESEKVQEMIVDAGIYLAGRTNFFRATQKRPTPDAFKFFTGSPWVILNRRFIEYCILGWENLPRILLMYFNNVMLPLEGYFHSVICNSLDFRNLTVNNDLRFMVRDEPPQTEPLFLSRERYGQMVDSGAPFARPFRENDPLLDKIDSNILKRWSHGAIPGAWCLGRKRWLSDPCSQWDDVNIVRPGPQAVKLHQYINRTLEEAKSSRNSCRR
ncbi:beta-glucuronosyltransferase GlcAT14B-like [Phragmites australis]|uniref:beta-glucuronosyltransferase GlcAT14B-like n=1 Tax=Phragmites australis TaxID=29695 RepID=UPI002D76D107|nr:beta-glucuronosyltransferase GlcAT14B-like [Phragmites australis]